ncbi:unnamed protein product [Vitrella brassicaformis CCMP3155]|uniref:TPM domain-containing protein n=1 Tax=Vitrella brassicaformis (strain CCMP3155) TaxID=1169540 RepID=A0A0G4EJ85_VITBC|nr:unnamed protein product [Vitrella brassicaformis CCMP3155]|eukprot:CEL96774.1 unnamed protein product [Vitrella brassicaformis CCMP3155]
MAGALYAFTTALFAMAGTDAVRPGAFVAPIRFSPPTTAIDKRRDASATSLFALFRLPGIFMRPSLSTLDPFKLTAPAIVQPGRLVGHQAGKRGSRRVLSSAEAAEIATDDESTITVPDGGEQNDKFSLSGVSSLSAVQPSSPCSLPSGPFPNPQYDLLQCGLRNKGWVCDPDGVLPSVYDREMIQRILNDIRDNCRLTCPDGEERGFQVSVALVRKMLLREGENKYSLAAKWATSIGNQWGVGDKGCGNGVIFFLSRDDRVVHIQAAKQAKLRVSNRDLTTIIDAMKPALRREDYSGAIRKGLTLLEAKLKDPSSKSAIAVSVQISDEALPALLIAAIILTLIMWIIWYANSGKPEQPKSPRRRSTSYSSYTPSYDPSYYRIQGRTDSLRQALPHREQHKEASQYNDAASRGIDEHSYSGSGFHRGPKPPDDTAEPKEPKKTATRSRRSYTSYSYGSTYSGGDYNGGGGYSGGISSSGGRTYSGKAKRDPTVQGDHSRAGTNRGLESRQEPTRRDDSDPGTSSSGGFGGGWFKGGRGVSRGWGDSDDRGGGTSSSGSFGGGSVDDGGGASGGW